MPWLIVNIQQGNNYGGEGGVRTLARNNPPSGLANRPLDHLGTSPYKAAAAHLKVRKSGLPHMEGRTSKKDKSIREREKSNQSGCKRPCSKNLLFPYTPKYIWKADVPQP